MNINYSDIDINGGADNFSEHREIPITLDDSMLYDDVEISGGHMKISSDLFNNDKLKSLFKDLMQQTPAIVGAGKEGGKTDIVSMEYDNDAINNAGDEDIMGNDDGNDGAESIVITDANYDSIIMGSSNFSLADYMGSSESSDASEEKSKYSLF